MKKSESLNTWLAIVISVLVAGSLYWIIMKAFPVVYAINDDVTMRDIAAGAISGEPDGHLIYSKYAFGFIISQMYRIFPGFDWYGIVMTGLIMASLSIILYRGLSDIKEIYLKVLYTILVLFLFICIGVQHVVIFQWTVTAAVVGGGGIFLFYTSSGENRLKVYLEETVAVLMLLIVFCIRWEIFVMVLPIAGICYLFKCVKFDKEKKNRLSIRHWGVPVALFLGCAAVLLIEKEAYQGEEWQNYLEYNNCRSEIYDFYGIPEYRGNEAFYESIDMEEADVEALKWYSLIVVDDIDTYKMKAIADYAEEIKLNQKGILERLWEGLDKIYADFESGEYAPLSWFIAIIMFLTFRCCYLRKSRQIWLGLACVGIQGILWCYLGIQGRVVNRVSFAMHFCFFLLFAAILYQEFQNGIRWENFERNKIIPIAFVCSSIILMGISTFELREIKTNASKIEAKNMECIELFQYMNMHEDNVYFLQTTSVEEYTDNFYVRREFKVGNHIWLGGWLSFSPIEMKKRELLGVTDGAKALREMDNTYVLSRIGTDYLVECLKNKYGSCHSELVDTIAYVKYFYTIEKLGE